jgi:hypothetical protein
VPAPLPVAVEAVQLHEIAPDELTPDLIPYSVTGPQPRRTIIHLRDALLAPKPLDARTSSDARGPRDPSSKRQSTAKSYEPFPFAKMAPNSPFASPLIPSVK